MTKGRGADLALLRKELWELSRDRRAIFFSFLLPVLLYPLIFSLSDRLERREEEKEKDRVYDIAVTGGGTLLWEGLENADGLNLLDVSGDLEEAVRDGDVEAGVDASAGIAAGGELPEWRLLYHGPRPSSRDARDRVQERLEEIREEESDRRYREAGGEPSALTVAGVEEVDVATEEEAGGAHVGRLLPFLLVMTLFVGGASISTDVVAGEKERGTLETLFLTPVGRARIARAKFTVVLLATVVSGFLNIGSMLFCYRMGWIDAGLAGGGVTVSPGGLLVSFLLIVPLATLVGAVLLGISAFARSLKEAQHYLTPLMLVAIIPGMFASSQEVRLDGFTALLPIANVALAVRDSLLGRSSWPLLALVLVASSAWGLAVVRWTASVLAREETILGFDPEPVFARTPGGRRRAALLGLAGTTLAYFYLGQLLQTWTMPLGLVLSLWVLLPALGFLSLRLAWAGGDLRDVLSLRRPSPSALAGGSLLAAGMIYPMFDGVMRLQGLFLPAPEALTEGMFSVLDDLATPQLLLLIAFSPAVCEEIVFRGAFLGVLRRTGTVRSAVLLSSAFFGLIHLSVFRFLPTGILGLVMAGLTVRTRSLFPAMVFHFFYNGIAVTSSEAVEGMMTAEMRPWMWAGSLLLLVLGTWLARRSPSS